MNELRNGTPSTVPRTFTRPRVPKNAAESGITTYVHPPLFGDFSRVAVNRLRNVVIVTTSDDLDAEAGRNSSRRPVRRERRIHPLGGRHPVGPSVVPPVA